MKKMTMLLMAVILILFNQLAMAQDEDEERDILEVNFYGGIAIPYSNMSDWNDSLGAKTGWDIGIDIGYFVAPTFVVGFDFVYTQFGIDGWSDTTDHRHRLYSPSIYAKYYFDLESDFEPYVKGQVGVENAKFFTTVDHPTAGGRFRELSYDPVLSAGFGVGLFYYTADYSGLFIEANYRWGNTQDVTATYLKQDYIFGESTELIDLRVGVRLLVGSGE
jgi:outer membrane protein W